MARSWLFSCCILVLVIYYCEALNKYSKEANQPRSEELASTPDFKDAAWKDAEKPFRLAKINTVWAKAQKVGIRKE